MKIEAISCTIYQFNEKLYRSMDAREGDETKTNKCDNDNGQEIEEGELSEEEESVSASIAVQCTPEIVSEKENCHQFHKSDHTDHHHHHQPRGSSSYKDKSSLDHSPSKSPRKRRQDSGNSKSADDKLSGVESFLKKRKEELAEKVKNQLRLAGIEAKIESGSDSDPECIKPDLMENMESNIGRKRSSKDRIPPAVPKYYDLDKIEDPTETMLTNWATKGKAAVPSMANGGNSVISAENAATVGSMSPDPYDEYYGASAPAAEESTPTSAAPSASLASTAAADQDLRRLPLSTASLITVTASLASTLTSTATAASGGGACSTDQDYRFNPGYDVDYRRKRRNRDDGGNPLPHEPSSGGELSDASGFASDADERRVGEPRRRKRRVGQSTANEFGDIDERKPSSASEARRSGATATRRSFRRGGEFDGARSGSESDYEIEEGRLFHPFRHEYGGRFKQQRSPFRRRGFGRFDGFGRPGSGNPPMCRYFKEGYCREGENCLFNHNIEQHPRGAGRIRELCRFYKFGYCRNGRSCPYMHGDYPCKEFHKCNNCKEGDNCRFSHDPLTDWTRPLFDRMVRDEPAYSAASHHKTASHLSELPSRRKVLLGEPPLSMSLGHQSSGQGLDSSYGIGDDSYAQSPLHSFNASSIVGGDDSSCNVSYDERAAAHHQLHYPNGAGLLAPPQPHPLPGGFYADQQTPMQSTSSTFPLEPKLEQQSLPYSSPLSGQQHLTGSTASHLDDRAAKGDLSVDITTMLRQIKAEVKGQQDFVDESPASPEPGQSDSVFANSVPLRQTVVRTVEYRLTPFDYPPPDSTYIQSLLKLSISDAKLSNDPRIKRMLANQFDAVSDMISSTQKVAIPPKTRDPRLKAGPAQDNAQQPQRCVIPPQPPTVGPPLVAPPIPPPMLDPATLPINQQMALLFNSAAHLMPNQPPSGSSVDQKPPQQHLPQNLFANVMSLQNFMKQQQQQQPGAGNSPLGIGWMPHMMGGVPLIAPPQPPPISSSAAQYGPPAAAHPNFFDPANQNEATPLHHNASRSSPPSSSFYGSGNQSPPSPAYHPLGNKKPGLKAEALPLKSFSPANDQSKGASSFADSSKLKIGVVKVESTPTNEDVEVATTTNQNEAPFSTTVAAARLSLREKRKNLEYESPLSSGGGGAAATATSGRSSTDENVRYYGCNVKIKKKEVVES